MSLGKRFCGIVIATLMVAPGAGLAQAGQPEPWQLGFQASASPVMTALTEFHDMLLWITFAIVALVGILMAVVVVRFNARANPQPSKTSHNTVLEVLWTAVPIMILVVIAVPSFKLLYYQDKAVDAEMTIKAVGHQWYWSYEYPDHGDFTFDSLMIPEDELAPGEPRLLATDTQVVVPVDTTVRLLTTADDVIHSWAIPAFGVKIDSIPGRVSETWFRAERTGIFYGQCSELCGAYHGYMPIMVEVVTAEEFAAWVEQAKEEFARARAPAPTVAAWSARGSRDE